MSYKQYTSSLCDTNRCIKLNGTTQCNQKVSGKVWHDLKRGGPPEYSGEHCNGDNCNDIVQVTINYAKRLIERV